MALPQTLAVLRRVEVKHNRLTRVDYAVADATIGRVWSALIVVSGNQTAIATNAVTNALGD